MPSQTGSTTAEISKELIDEGLNERPELRLFETGWSGGKATYLVTEPLFLLDQPAELCRLRASIPVRP